MTYVEFKALFESVAPSWIRENPRTLFNVFRSKVWCKNQPVKVFNLTEFVLLMIIHGKATTQDKLKLMFDYLLIFTNNSSSNTLPDFIISRLTVFLYKHALLYIPRAMCTNMLYTGKIGFIQKAVYQANAGYILDFTKFFKDLSAYLHLRTNSPDIPLSNREVLELLHLHGC